MGRLNTNPSSGGKEDLNTGPPDYNSSALTPLGHAASSENITQLMFDSVLFFLTCSYTRFLYISQITKHQIISLIWEFEEAYSTRVF